MRLQERLHNGYTTVTKRLQNGYACQALSALTNTFARAWMLRVEVTQCSTEDDPRGGLVSKQSRVGSCEQRCAAVTAVTAETP